MNNNEAKQILNKQNEKIIGSYQRDGDWKTVRFQPNGVCYYHHLCGLYLYEERSSELFICTDSNVDETEFVRRLMEGDLPILKFDVEFTPKRHMILRGLSTGGTPIVYKYY